MPVASVSPAGAEVGRASGQEGMVEGKRGGEQEESGTNPGGKLEPTSLSCHRQSLHLS